MTPFHSLRSAGLSHEPVQISAANQRTNQPDELNPTRTPKPVKQMITSETVVIITTPSQSPDGHKAKSAGDIADNSGGLNGEASPSPVSMMVMSPRTSKSTPGPPLTPFLSEEIRQQMGVPRMLSPLSSPEETWRARRDGSSDSADEARTPGKKIVSLSVSNIVYDSVKKFFLS